ncbi:MAG: NAD(P)/FAD-dependent oxidoreductase [Rhizomicrobium sp.]|nr:NAD(P)/FAD-dependent oxidoreductase [Rhizomicrobium sp.]
MSALGQAIVVIGAGLNGLVAATYLARAGHAVTLVEADGSPGGMCANRVPISAFAVPPGPHLFTALDPRIIKELDLNLAFVARDLPLIGLRAEGPPLLLPRDVHEARRHLAPLSQRDGERFAAFRREHFAFARAMRALWWEEGELTDEHARATLRRMQVTSAAAWLDGAFESESLLAAYAFDVLAAGLSPSAAGSALLFTWRAAQEMCGLQGAVAIPDGGPSRLIDAMMNTAEAAGVAIRFESAVRALETDGERVRGVVLASGEKLPAAAVLSSLSKRQTLIDFLPPGRAGFATARALEKPQSCGEAKVLLTLSALPKLFEQPGRYVIAERLETSASAHAAARTGVIPADLALEIVALPTGGTPPVLLSILVRPVPVEPIGGWKDQATRLVQAVLHKLELHIPQFTGLVAGLAFVPPKSRDPFCMSAMVSPWRARIQTPLKGLYLCGEAAEPVPCLSGRAARIAAALVVADLQEAKT